MLPISELSIKAFITIWKDFDPEATKFMLTRELEALILRLASDEDG